MTSKSKASIFKPKVYTTVFVHKEPHSVHEAFNDLRCFEAITNEYNTLVKNGTWSFILRIANQKVVDKKLVSKAFFLTLMIA